MTRKLALALFLALSAAACAKREPARGDGACDCGSAVVDPTLLAFLSKARALHHQADALETQDDVVGAIGALEKIVATPAPNAPEADEVIADTRARLSELYAKRADFDRARESVERGLEHARETSYFRGHLFEVLGLVEERRAAALDKAGDKAGAAAARKRAIDASAEAVKIQDDVIQRALGKGGSKP